MKMAGERNPAERSVLLLAALFCISAVGRCTENVPLLIWTSNGFSLPPQSAPSAGQTLSGNQLDSYLDSAFSSAPHNVLLFLQDKLSVDDFTMYAGVFGNKQDSAFPHLEATLQSSSSSLLPSVSSSASAALPTLLQGRLGAAPLYMDPETLAQLRLNSSVPALLVFSLPYSSSGADMMSVKEVLSSNDQVISQVLRIMDSQVVPYTAIYSALRPSRVTEDAGPALHSGGARSLLQYGREAPPPPYAPVEFKERGSPCILLWAHNLTISEFRSGKWERHNLGPKTFGEGVTPKLEGSFCNATHSKLVLNYENVLSYRTFKLIFIMTQRHYAVSARRWFTVDTVQLQYDGKTATFNASRGIYAPVEYSYRCHSVNSFSHPLLTPRSAKDSANDWRVSFHDFQIQGFNVMGREFSYASDCASFFTPGIWMGLLVSALMALLLTYGLHMIMQLHTMDRFDDPKGPAISVPQTD